MRAIDICYHEPVTISADSTITVAAKLMDKEAVGAVVVVDSDGLPAGIVTDRDITVRGVAREAPSDARVDFVMTTELVTVEKDAEVHEILALFRTNRFRRVPVVDGGRMVGMVTADDLLLRVFDDLSDLLLPITKQTLHGRPEPGIPAVVE